MTRGVFGVLMAAGLAAASSCASGGARVGPSDPRELVYVVSQAGASATVLAAEDGSVVATVDFAALGYGENARPHYVVSDPDGSHWYVSLIGAGRVVKLDGYHRVVDEAPFEAAGMLALDPATDWLYVGRSMAAVDPPQRIGMIRRSAMAISEVDVFFPRPHALAIDSKAGRVYSASLAENRLAMAPLGSEDVDLLGIEGPLHTIVQLAVSPDGRWLVGTGQMSGQLLVWDVSGEEPRSVAVVPVGGQPWHPSFTGDGAQLWIPNLTDNAVTVVETSGWTVTGVVTHPALVEPHGSAVSADGSTVFVTGRNTSGAYGQGAPGTVVAVDVASRSVRWVAEVGPYAAGIAVRGRPGAGARS
jgi:DNA-binding beta-propeller fold protein YncE